MKDKQTIECKYKFQSIEKFAGRSYCTLHNETCEFINFACDKNCQVYEDYKQLKAKEQECKELYSKCSQLKLENIKQANKILALKSKRLNMFEYLDIVQKNIEYKEFLKDLKVTAERARKHLFVTKSEDYSDGMKWLGCLLWNRIEELEEKLQKINEVIDA